MFVGRDSWVMWTAEIWSFFGGTDSWLKWTAEIWSCVCRERQLFNVDSRNMERCLLRETAGRFAQQRYGAVFVGRNSWMMWTTGIWSGVFG
jgi:hypothetical protein